MNDMNEIMETFGERLKRLRLEANLTQEELATAAGISKQSISNYEQSISFPITEYLYLIAEALNVSAEILYRGYDNNLDISEELISMDQLAKELLKLNSLDQIKEIHDSELTGSSSINITEASDLIIIKIKEKWEEQGIFTGSYVLKPYILDTVIKYAANRSHFKEHFSL